MSNALARRIGTSKYRRRMSAFQFVSLLPTYHLVNGQTSDQANWAHGRRPEASSSRVLKTLQDSGKRGYRRSRGIPAQPASCSKRPCHTRPPRTRQDARHSLPKAVASEGASRTVFIRRASERSENEAGGVFQQSASQGAQFAGRRRLYRNRFSHS